MHDVQARAACHRAGEQSSTATAAHTAAAREADVAACGGTSVGGLAGIEHQRIGRGVGGADGLGNGHAGIGLDLDGARGRQTSGVHRAQCQRVGVEVFDALDVARQGLHIVAAVGQHHARVAAQQFQASGLEGGCLGHRAGGTCGVQAQVFGGFNRRRGRRVITHSQGRIERDVACRLQVQVTCAGIAGCGRTDRQVARCAAANVEVARRDAVDFGIR